jgi:adenylate cyclase
MDRIYQWTWDRYGARYSWALCAISVPISVPAYLFWAFLIVAVEKSGDYVDAAAVAVVAVPVLAYVIQLPGLGRVRVVER